MPRGKGVNMSKYEGIFFKLEELEKVIEKANCGKRLAKTIERPHVTTAFNPASPSVGYKIGEKVSVTVIGYGNDGKNEGFLVALPTGKPCCNKQPHITVSIAHDGKAVDTGRLKFYPIDPIEIEGRFGYFNGKELIGGVKF